MAKAASATKGRPPAPVETAANDTKYINFRVSWADFVDIKTAALREGLTLGQYMVHAHKAHKAKKG